MTLITKPNRPIPGMTYTLDQITQMHLGDSPCLQIRDVGVVQDSHLSEEELLAIPDMKGSKWIYVRTTSELIPVFLYAIDNPAYTQLFDTEPYKDPYNLTTDLCWVTPKGYPRSQDM